MLRAYSWADRLEQQIDRWGAEADARESYNPPPAVGQAAEAVAYAAPYTFPGVAASFAEFGVPADSPLMDIAVQLQGLAREPSVLSEFEVGPELYGLAYDEALDLLNRAHVPEDDPAVESVKLMRQLFGEEGYEEWRKLELTPIEREKFAAMLDKLQLESPEVKFTSERSGGVKTLVRDLLTAFEGGSDLVEHVARIGGAAGSGQLALPEGARRATQQTGFTPLPDPTGLKEKQTRQIRFGSDADLFSLDQNMAWQAFVRGESTGTGWLPAGEAIQEAAVAKRRSASIVLPDGSLSGATPGRLVAASVFDAGTKPYNIMSGLVDFGQEVFLDPADLGLLAGAKIARSRRLFTSADLLEEGGRLNGLRRAVHGPTASAYLDSRRGRAIIDNLVEADDYDVLFRRLKGRGFHPDEIRRLVEANDPAAVRSILDETLGISVRQLLPRRRFTSPLRDTPILGRVLDARVLDQMPLREASIYQPEDLVEQTRRLGVEVGLDRNAVSAGMADMAQASATSRAAIYESFTRFMDQIASHLKKDFKHISDTQARRLTTAWKDELDRAELYFRDQIGENVDIPGFSAEGNPVQFLGPHRWDEYLLNYIPLPNARDLRHAASRINRIYMSLPYQLAERAFDVGTQRIFKPFVLALRPAWTVRVIGEEQIRIAVTGYTSLFNHPLRHIAWAIGQRGDTDVLGKMIPRGGKAANLSAPEMLLAVQALSRPRTTKLTEGLDAVTKVAFKDYRLFERGTDGWVDAVARQVVRSNDFDPVTEAVIRFHVTGELPEGADDIHTWFRNSQFREKMVEGNPDDLLPDQPGFAGHVTTEWTEDGRLLVNGEDFNWRAMLAHDWGADIYVDSLLTRAQTATGSDPKLMEAIATGKIDGQPIMVKGRPSAALKRHIEAMQEAGEGPVRIPGEKITSRREMGIYNGTVDWAFDVLMSRPTNFLSRSPVFRQAYWNRVDELAPYLSREDAEQMVANAGKANLERWRVDSLRKKGATATRETPLELEDLDDLAKAFGLDETKKLLYDISERGNFSDAARNILPFAEAWKEVLTRWARLSIENPRVVRRLQQVVQGAEDEGLFFEDSNGDTVFGYPWSKELNQGIAGVPIPLVGSVEGLNLVTSTIGPGFGPWVQIPAAAILGRFEDKFPQHVELWDSIRSVITPFGDPEIGDGILEAWFPPWIQRLRTIGWTPFGSSADQVRTYGNTHKDVMTYLVSTGVPTGSEADLQALEADAEPRTDRLYAFRAFVAAWAPSAPRFETQVLVDGKVPVVQKDGDEIKVEKLEGLMAIRTLAEDYRKMQQEDYESAPMRFLKKYGELAFLVMQGRSYTSMYMPPADEKSWVWWRQHQGLVQDYGEIAGFFAPRGGDFSWAAYRSMWGGGPNADRFSYSNNDWLRAGNGIVGNLLYSQMRDQVGNTPNEEQAEWLAAGAEEIGRMYPGWRDTTLPSPRLSMNSTQDRQELLSQFEKIIAEPDVHGTEAATAVGLYLEARRQAVESYSGAESGWATAKRAEPQRAWLRDTADRIIAEYPAFAPMWDQVFSREGNLRDPGQGDE